MSEETSRNIAQIGTAWLSPQREKQTSSHLRRASLVGNVTRAMSKQKHQRITTKKRSQFFCWIILLVRWTHTLNPIMMLWCHPSCAYFQPCLVSREETPVQSALQYYAHDLTLHQVLRVELLSNQQFSSGLGRCDHEFFPKIHKLLRILCTLPITSTAGERSFSTLRRLQGHHQTSDLL